MLVVGNANNIVKSFKYTGKDTNNAQVTNGEVNYYFIGTECKYVRPCTVTIALSVTGASGLAIVIARQSNVTAQEPSAVYDAGAGSSSYVVNTTAADLSLVNPIQVNYGDVLYVNAAYIQESGYTYRILAQNFTVTGDETKTITVTKVAESL